MEIIIVAILCIILLEVIRRKCRPGIIITVSLSIVLCGIVMFLPGHNIIISVILCIALLFASMILGKYILTNLVSDLLCKHTYDKISYDKKKIFKYGIVSDLLAILFIVLYGVIMEIIYFPSLLSISSIAENLIYSLLSFTIYPFYNSIIFDGDFSTFIPIISAIVISIIISFLFYFYLIFRKSELSFCRKILNSCIFALCTAPYYFLISFSFIVYLFFSI